MSNEDAIYVTLEPTEEPTERDIRAANVYYRTGDLCYIGSWFQFTKHDRRSWNNLLVNHELPDPQTCYGAICAQRMGYLDNIIRIEVDLPDRDRVTSRSKKPRPTNRPAGPLQHDMDVLPAA